MPISTVECCDCMDFMAQFPDKYFDLAIVDPPYGIGHFTQSDRVDKYGDYKWNEKPPGEDYFKELLRVSKERIVFGANYYNCFENGKAAIIWDKENPHPSMSRCEIASVSFGKKVGYIKIHHYGFVGKHDNFHPCGKPVSLYQWVIQNYAKPGQKILDTHLGSQSSRIAAYQMGFDFWGCEIDPEYFEQGCKRFEKEASQQALFTPETTTEEQNKLFKEVAL